MTHIAPEVVDCVCGVVGQKERSFTLSFCYFFPNRRYNDLIYCSILLLCWSEQGIFTDRAAVKLLLVLLIVVSHVVAST